MTVARTNNRWTFPGGTSAVSFAITEVVYDATHLAVGVVNDTTRVYTALALGSGFTVTGVGNPAGCTVTLTATLAAGTTLYVDIRPPATQTLALKNAGAFNPQDIERRFDELTYRLHALEEADSRSVKFAQGESTTAQLANIDTRKSKLLGFTASGALDYLANAPGAGSFMNLPTALAFPSGGKVLFQTAAGAGGGTVFYADVGEIQNAPYAVVTYATSTTLSTGDSGKVIKSTGQAANIVYTLPAGAAGLFYMIHCDSDAYNVTLDPNGSERISYGGANKSLTMLARGWIVLQWDGGRWEITEDAGFYEIEA